HMRGVDTKMGKHKGHQAARQAFSIARESIDGFGTEFTENLQLPEQISHFAKMAVESPAEFALTRHRKQHADFALVHFPQSAQPLERVISLGPPGDRRLTQRQKLLGGL